MADANGDKRLSTTEIKRMGKLLIYYLDDTHFQRTDTDKDGMLNESELAYRMGQAIVHRLETDEKELKKLEQEYPYFSDAKVKYLKRHPELAERLMENLVWSRTHPDQVVKIISDRSWLNQNPNVAKSLNRNLIWLVENPEPAVKFYRLREAKMQNGYMKSWRSIHKEYLNQHPELMEKPVMIDFPYWPEKKTMVTAENYMTPAAWDPDQATIDSLIRLNRNQKEKYENQIANMLNKQKQRDSITHKIQDSPLDPVYTGDNIETLKVANEELRKRVKQLRIEHKLAMIEEDSLLATTIRQRIRIGLLEKSLDLASTDEVIAKQDENTLIKSIEPKIESMVIEDKVLEEKKELLAEIGELRKQNDELTARIEQMGKEYEKQERAFESLNQSVVTAEKAQANMKFMQDSLRNAFEKEDKVSHAKEDSLLVEISC